MIGENAAFQKVTRGGQIALHVFTMYCQILKTVIFVVLGLTIVFNAAWFFTNNSADKREVFVQYMNASLRAAMNEKSTQELKDGHGKTYLVKSFNYKNAPVVQRVVGDIYVNMVHGAIISLFFALFGFFGITFWLKRMGTKATESKVLNEHALETVSNVNKLLLKNKARSPLKISDLHLVKDSETKHILALGTTGSGKSNLIKSLISQIIARGDKFIVFDKSCDLVNQFYQPDRAVILNPFDERTPSWNIWSDTRDSADFKSLAEALLPMPTGSGGDPFWISAARILFSATAYQMRNDQDKSTVKLLKKLLTTGLDDMQQYLAHTEAATLVSKEIEKTAVSIKTQLATNLSSLKYLKDEGDTFSIRKWVQEESDIKGVFITSLADKHHVLMPLISMWLDLSLNAVMSLKPDMQRRIWIILDEAQSLHTLPCLFSGVNEARKFGGSIVLASTSRFALTDLYGHERAKSILGQFNTSVFFRTPDYDGSAWVSKELGESEIEEVHENYSYGANTMRDGVSLTKQRLRRSVVPYTDIQHLPDHEAYIKLPGKYPITKVVFPLIKSKRNGEVGFKLREVNEDVFKEVHDLEDIYTNRQSEAKEFQNNKKADPLPSSTESEQLKPAPKDESSLNSKQLDEVGMI